jgi:hypothetical protein
MARARCQSADQHRQDDAEAAGQPAHEHATQHGGQHGGTRTGPAAPTRCWSPCSTARPGSRPRTCASSPEGRAARPGGPRRGRGAAWWRDVFGGADDAAEVVHDWRAGDAPIAVGPLADPARRRATCDAASRQASGAAAPARDAALDGVLARASLGGEPLFLAVFGLVAARQATVLLVKRFAMAVGLASWR